MHFTFKHCLQGCCQKCFKKQPLIITMWLVRKAAGPVSMWNHIASLTPKSGVSPSAAINEISPFVNPLAVQSTGLIRSARSRWQPSHWSLGTHCFNSQPGTTISEQNCKDRFRANGELLQLSKDLCLNPCIGLVMASRAHYEPSWRESVHSS